MGESDLSLLNALVSATGWTLIHFLWQGCIIVALYWLLCVFSKPQSAHLRYWAGLSSYLLALCTLPITFLVYYEPAAEFSSEPIASDAVNSFIVLSGSRPDLWTSLQAGIEPALPWVVVLWLIGVGMLSVKTTCGWFGTRRLLRSGVSPISAELQQAVNGLVESLAVKHAVTVLRSTLVRVPMVIGWFKPVILLPASVLAQMPVNQLEMVIAHELGHIKRYDYLVNLLQIVVETLLFYHPAIRWMSRRIREEREHCCDDLVVTSCGKPVVYAKALANLEVMREPMAATVMAATGGELLDRVRRIVDTELPRNGSGYAQVSMMAVVALIVALGAQQGLSLTRALTDIAESARLQVSNIEIETWSRSRAAWTAGVDRFTRQGGFYPAVEEAIAEEKPPRGQAAENVKRPEPVFTHSADAPLTETLLAVADPEPDQGETKVEPEIIEDWRSLRQDAVIVETPDSNTATAFANTGFHPGVPGGLTREAVEKTAQTSPAQIKPLKTAQPRYPMRARSRGIEGFVKLRFTLDEKGSTKDIEVADAFPEDIFDRAAIKALKKWRFDVSNGESTSRKLTQTFDFNLNDEVRYVNNYHDCAVTGRRTCGRGQRGAIVVYVNPPESRKGPSELK